MNSTRTTYQKVETQMRALFPDVTDSKDGSWTALLDCMQCGEEDVLIMMKDFSRHRTLVQLNIDQPTLLDYLVLSIAYYTGIVLWSDKDQSKNILLEKLQLMERMKRRRSIESTGDSANS